MDKKRSSQLKNLFITSLIFVWTFVWISSTCYANEGSQDVPMDSAHVQDDLGFPDFESLGFTEESMILDSLQMPSERRIKMLTWHQRLGITTAALMTATMLAGQDGEVSDYHRALGITTGLFYYTTAGFSLFAPKPKVKKESGNIVLHKYLAWIHGTSMLLAPVLGYLAARKLDGDGSGQSLNNPDSLQDHLIANHGNIVRIGYFSFISAMFVMVIEF